MIILNYPQGSDDWLRARCGVITASRFVDAVSVLTKASKNGAAGDPAGEALRYAWQIAVETISREPLDDTFTNFAMRRGRELEPFARQAYELRTDSLIEEASLVLTDDARFGYSTDGLRDEDGLIEIKCPMAADKIGNVWAHPEAAHVEYIDQINGGLWITGRQYCDLVVYCPWLAPVGKDLFIKRIHRDEAAIEKLSAGLIRFMRIVDTYVGLLRAPRASDTAIETATVAPALGSLLAAA